MMKLFFQRYKSIQYIDKVDIIHFFMLFWYIIFSSYFQALLYVTFSLFLFINSFFRVRLTSALMLWKPFPLGLSFNDRNSKNMN